MNQARPSGVLGSSEVPLSQAYDLGILDLDGVVYVGEQAVAGAATSVAAAIKAGMRCCYLTNNASRPAAVIGQHLRDLGLPADDDDVVTSAQVAAALLAAELPAGAPVLVIGGAGLRDALREKGLVPVDSLDDPHQVPQAVVQGFNPELTWSDLANGTRGVRAGLPWTATNLDLTFPTPFGPAPGNGSLVQAVANAAGRRPDRVAGKPDAAPFHASAARYGATRPLVVGDRLDTDLEGAVNAGMDSLAVLTGVATVADLIHAPAAARPTYLSFDLSGLGTAHPAVQVEADRAQCREAVVSRQGEQMIIEQSGSEPLDVLRAACGLSWATFDRDAVALKIDTVVSHLSAAELVPLR